MKIPSDDETRTLWYAATASKGEDPMANAIADGVLAALRWGLSNLARAMRAEWHKKHGGPQYCKLCGFIKPEDLHPMVDKKHIWTDAQWLQAAAESIGVKLEEK